MMTHGIKTRITHLKTILSSCALLLCWGCSGASSPTVTLAEQGVSSCNSATNEAASLDWMVGCWRGETDGKVTSERWRSAADGWLLGDNRTTRGGTLVHEERMRIQHDPEGWRYHASPQGQSDTVFTAAAMGHHCADFVNPVHDFPKRVGYRRLDSNEMIAFIAGNDDGQQAPTVWRWQSVDCSTVRD